MRNKLGYIVLVLLVAQLALILLSWLVTAAFPELPMRSVLSSEGIRWFFGSFVSNQLSPLLIYFIMAVMAVGACVRSRLYDALRETLSNTRSSLTTSSNHQENHDDNYHHGSPHCYSPRYPTKCDRTAIPQFLLVQFYTFLIAHHHHYVTYLRCSKWYD